MGDSLSRLAGTETASGLEKSQGVIKMCTRFVVHYIFHCSLFISLALFILLFIIYCAGHSFVVCYLFCVVVGC